MDEPSNEGPSGLHRMIIDMSLLEIYGFPIGFVATIVIFVGLFSGFVWLLGKLLKKLGFDPNKRLWGSGNHDGGGDFGGDFGG